MTKPHSRNRLDVVRASNDADDPAGVDVAVRLPPLLERLLEEADVPTEGTIYCANCDAAISHIDARLEVNGSFDHQFTNPHGFTHHFGCYSYAPGCTISGGAHAADTWFPGFAWHLATCTQCADHMGWWFEHKNENFFRLDPEPSIHERRIMSLPAAHEIDVLTFDCYGTLIDWATGIVQYIQPVLEAHDAHVTDQFILEFFANAEPAALADGRRYGDALKEVLSKLGARLAFTPTDAVQDGFVDSVRAWPAFDDSAAALAELAGKAELVVISNIDNDLLSASEETLGLKFTARVTAEDVGAYKPSPRMFDAAAEIINGRRHIHVAQSAHHDIIPATERGWQTAWIRRNASAAMALQSSPTWAFDSLRDFADALA